VRQAWLWWTLLAVICWGIWAIIFRFIGEALTAGQSQALSTVGLLPVIAMLSVKTGASGRKLRRGVWLAMGAGVLTCLGNIAYYWVLNSGAKAVQVVPLTALYPVVTVFLGLLVLKERLNAWQGAGVLLAMMAIFYFNISSASYGVSQWLLAAFVPILLWGVSGFLQKLSTNDVSGEVSAVWFLLAFVPVAAILLALEPLQANPTARIWGWSMALGLSFAFGNFAILQAFARNGKASVIAPLAGLYPAVSIPLSVMLFHERVGMREMIGIIAATVGIIGLSMESPSKKAAT
jgi:uncharacterized membrane protein